MLAEVQKLAVELNLTGNVHSAVPQAEQAFAGLNQAATKSGGATSIVSRGFGAVKNAASGVAGALGHAKNQLLGLLTGPLGMLGLGAGLFSIGGLFKSGIDKAREFGGEVKRLAALTGLSVETTSKLAGAFDHFGISADTVARLVGVTQKNIGLLTETTTKGGASADQLAKAHERLRVAQLKLNEVEGKRNHTASQIVAAQNRVADATRTLNKLTADSGSVTSKAADFYKQYGLSIVDAHGKVRAFDEQLLIEADYWNNKGIPQQVKILALTKLHGKAWQELLPFLAAGRTGIIAVEQEAARLGLTITKDNIDALTKSKEATRQWSDALGGLKLQIGLAVLPTLTNLTRGLSSFVIDNRERIVGFIRGITEGGAKLASAFSTSVLPAVKSVISIFQTAAGAAGGVSFVGLLSESANFAKDLGNALNSFVVPAIKTMVDGWNRLPDELRQLLIKGFLVNRVVKWTFGFDAVGFGLSMAKSFIGAVLAEKVATTVAGGLGSAASLLKPVPVFVTNEGFGNLPNVLAPAAGAGAAGLFGAGGILGTGLTVAGLGIIAAPIAAAVVVTLLAHQPGTVPNPAQSPLLNPPGGQTGTGGGVGGMPYGSASKPATVVLGGRDTDKLGDISADQRAAQMGMGALGNAMAEQTQAQLQGQGYLNRDMDKLVNVTGSSIAVLRSQLQGVIDAVKRARTDPELRKAASALLAAVKQERGRGTLSLGSATLGVKELRDSISALAQKRLHTNDPETRRVLDSAIASLKAKLAGRELVVQQLAAMERISKSSESSKQKLAELQRLQAKLLVDGNQKAAAIVAARINALKADLHAATARSAAQIAAEVRRKKLIAINNTTVNVYTQVAISAREQAIMQKRSTFYTHGREAV